MRITPRTRRTAWAIALACMVLVGTLSLVEGLRGGADSVLGRLQTAPYLYTRGGDLLASRIAPASLASLSLPFDALRVHTGQLEVNGLDLSVVVVSIEHHDGANVTTDYPIGANDLSLDEGLVTTVVDSSGSPVAARGTLTVLEARLASLPIVDPPPSRPGFLPDNWVYVRPELLAQANPAEGAPIQAVVTSSPLDPAATSALGLTRFNLVGVAGFVQGSTDEAEAALAPLVLVIAAVIGLLVYHALSLEIHQRREEIRTLRSVGAPPGLVALAYEGQALTLAAIGATVGSGLGIVLAHGVVAVAPLVGLSNLVILSVPWLPTGLAFAAALGASVLGGFVPSRRAALLVRAKKEAV